MDSRYDFVVNTHLDPLVEHLQLFLWKKVKNENEKVAGSISKVISIFFLIITESKFLDSPN